MSNHVEPFDASLDSWRYLELNLTDPLQAFPPCAPTCTNSEIWLHYNVPDYAEFVIANAPSMTVAGLLVVSAVFIFGFLTIRSIYHER